MAVLMGAGPLFTGLGGNTTGKLSDMGADGTSTSTATLCSEASDMLEAVSSIFACLSGIRLVSRGAGPLVRGLSGCSIGNCETEGAGGGSKIDLVVVSVTS
jgi:hypothetical protein